MAKRKLVHLLGSFQLAVASLIGTAALPAKAVLAPLNQDTFVLSTAPTAVHGGWGSVNVNGAAARGLLEFEVGAVLPAGTTATQVQKASLILFVEWLDAAGSIEVVRLTGTFNEGTTTNASFPLHTGVGTGKTAALSGSVRPLVIDITDLVRAAITAGQTRLGLAILPAAATPTVAVQLGAKEGKRPAQLDITLGAPATTGFWATSSALESCAATCLAAVPPATAQADISGNVCSRPDGTRFRSTQYRGTLPVGQRSLWACGTWSGSPPPGSVGIGVESERVAQCHCAR
jgi:hypothetical protein